MTKICQLRVVKEFKNIKIFAILENAKLFLTIKNIEFLTIYKNVDFLTILTSSISREKLFLSIIKEYIRERQI